MAHTNFVDPDVLLEHLGLRPRPLDRFDRVLKPRDVEAFARAGRLEEESVRSMSFADIPRHIEPFISTRSDFQICRGCNKLWNPVTKSFDTITLKHCRHSRVLDCSICGRPLEYIYPDDGWDMVYPSRRHKKMARLGAEALGSAVERGDHRWLHHRAQNTLRLGAVLKGRPLAYAGLTNVGYAARIWCLCAIHRATHGPLRKAAWLYLGASPFGRYLIRDEFRDEPGLRHTVLRVADNLAVYKQYESLKRLKQKPSQKVIGQPVEKSTGPRPTKTDIEKAVASSLNRRGSAKRKNRREHLRKLLREADQELQALRRDNSTTSAQLKSH